MRGPASRAPVLLRPVTRFAHHDRTMLDRLTEVLRLVGRGHCDAGILTATNGQADDVNAVSGLQASRLSRYRPASSAMLSTFRLCRHGTDT